MKVLISCYGCSPYHGSEAGMGWNFVNNLAPLHELHIIVMSDFETELQRYFIEHPEEQHLYHFYFLPNDKRNHTLIKIWPPSYYWYYRKWQKKVFEFAKVLDMKEHFDVVHMLNMAGYREPGYLYKMSKPLIWGPVGGFCISPWRLLPGLGLYGMVYYGMRNIVNWMHACLKISPRRMAKNATTIIAATQDNQKAILRYYNRQSVLIPEVGILPNNYVPSLRDRGTSPLKICWSGRHIPSKALHLLLYALSSLLPSVPLELHVIGGGVCTNKWIQLAHRLNLDDYVRWHGQVSRENAIHIMSQSHVFVITSIADLTSTVLLEALSLGLPVITLNLFGFSNVVTKDCGIKIDVRTEQQVIQDLAAAICTIANDEPLRLRMATAASCRAHDFVWEDKAKQISQLYKNAVVNMA